ncbi:hypothetical protein [Tsukamurella pseudospumae]|uniref:Uncharacterized protein n=1 Tax=Tsukamurella pseudospumae TaxID=239498 RepID=A0A138ATR8_9ACTN|nr:hypothetical protein [Tsukamurella pseudospumae]KXO97851.1 hypothetical protein AXK61_20995 [Tsukamurella pseudospumae]KXP13840.1 hypothetical protein AXK60_23005 [Tsukamurella pseudospumae]
MRYDMVLTGTGSGAIHGDFGLFARALATRLRARSLSITENGRQADIRVGDHGRVAPGMVATAPDEFAVLIESDWADDMEHNAFGDLVHTAVADVLPGVQVVLLNPADDEPLRTIVRHGPSAA